MTRFVVLKGREKLKVSSCVVTCIGRGVANRLHSSMSSFLAHRHMFVLTYSPHVDRCHVPRLTPVVSESALTARPMWLIYAVVSFTILTFGRKRRNAIWRGGRRSGLCVTRLGNAPRSLDLYSPAKYIYLATILSEITFAFRSTQHI
jgi:hypothetical protein